MDKQLSEKLHQLHTELEHTRAVDEQERKLLRDLMSDIQLVLERSAQPSATSSTHSAVERMRNTLQQFEAAHPQLTSVVGQLAHILSQMGI